MSTIDVGQLLTEVSADAPCGTNLEYDPAFREHELAATGKPEQRIGDSVVAGQEPNWPDVKDRAIELLRRTKDLRIAVQLTRSLLRTNGAAGLSDGLHLIAGMLDRFWDGVYPQLDPDDNNDPTFRLNALANLADLDLVVRALREMPLVHSRRLGRFSLRDIEMADGTLPPPAEGEPAGADLGTIMAAFGEAEAGELESTVAGIRGAAEALSKIQSVVSSKVGSAGSVDLSRLSATLRSADRILSEHAAQGAPVSAGGDGAPEGAPTAARAAGISGEIQSREDVLRLLDKACDYYRRHEPSSPVPLLLMRAKRLVSKDFVEIMKDMAPGGLSEVKTIGGLDTEQ